MSVDYDFRRAYLEVRKMSFQISMVYYVILIVDDFTPLEKCLFIPSSCFEKPLPDSFTSVADYPINVNFFANGSQLEAALQTQSTSEMEFQRHHHLGLSGKRVVVDVGQLHPDLNCSIKIQFLRRRSIGLPRQRNEEIKFV